MCLTIFICLTFNLQFDIHETLVIEEKVIVSGIVNKGLIRSGFKYHLGPYNDGTFKTVEILNIHCKKIPVKSVSKGQYCSIWIKSSSEKIKREDLRKGMVLLDMQIKPVATKIFEADIWTIDGTRKTLKSKYQPVLNIKHIRQGCRILEFKNKHGNINNNTNINKNSNLNNLVNTNGISKNVVNSNFNNDNNFNILEKKSQDSNICNEINCDTINNFVACNAPDLNNANWSPNSSDIRITNIHPLRNLPNKSDLKGSFDNNNLNNKIVDENDQIVKEVRTFDDNLSTDKIENQKENIEISQFNNMTNDKVKNEEIKNETTLNIDNNLNETKKKNSANNGPKKSDYNSDNAVNNTINKDTQKANKAIKQQHKKSSISKKEELEVKIKSDFNSDKKIIKINNFNSEYANLKSKENDDNEETCIISPHNNCTVVFEFMYYPEYITEDANVLISDQLIKAHGIVKKLLV